MIRTTLARLESLKFFIRHNISKGDRGGLSAYSLRHSEGSQEERRVALAKDCADWQAFRNVTANSESRANDRLLHIREKTSQRERIAAIQAEAESLAKPLRQSGQNRQSHPLGRPEEPRLKPSESDSGPSEGQVGANLGPSAGPSQGQHNEKDSSEKDPDEKDIGNLGMHIWKASHEDREEHGHIIEGKFLSSLEINTLVQNNPAILDELSKRARPAIRCRGADGTEIVEEVAIGGHGTRRAAATLLLGRACVGESFPP